MKQVSMEGILKVINCIGNLCVTEDNLTDNLVDIGMDSITYIRIVVALEDMFECEIPDTKLLITEMNTIKKMIDVLNGVYEENINT